MTDDRPPGSIPRPVAALLLVALLAGIAAYQRFVWGSWRRAAIGAIPLLFVLLVLGVVELVERRTIRRVPRPVLVAALAAAGALGGVAMAFAGSDPDHAYKGALVFGFCSGMIGLTWNRVSPPRTSHSR